MLFSEQDMAFLRLACWCKTLPKNIGVQFSSIYNDAGIALMEHLGLIAYSRDGKYIRPKPYTYDFLMEAGYDIKSEYKPQTKQNILLRRTIAAQIVFTFYRAGISVFNDRFHNHMDYPVYVPAFAARLSTPNNPFGSAKFYGVFCTAQQAYLVFYIDDTGVHFQKEMILFHNLIEITGIQRLGIIYMGKSSDAIGKQVFQAQEGKKNNMDSFSKIFEATTLPVYFLPVGDAGAQELVFMKRQSYHEAIVKAIFKSSYKPPYKNMADTDTIHYTEPYYPAIVSVDMDVKRIDRALAAAEKEGFQKIAIYALTEQIPFLQKRYGQFGKAELLEIEIDTLDLTEIQLYQPPNRLFVTDQGRFFDVKNLESRRKNGKEN